jgi:integrase
MGAATKSGPFKLKGMIGDTRTPDVITDIVCRTPGELAKIVVAYDFSGNKRSLFSDVLWHFSSYYKVNNTTRTSLDFSSIAPMFRHTVKSHIWLLMRNRRAIAVTTLQSYLTTSSGLQNLTSEIGGKSFEFLNTDNNYTKLLELCKKKRFSQATLKHMFNFINRLDSHGLVSRKILNINKLVTKLGRSSKQTIAIPERLASAIYKDALATVRFYHTYRHSIGDAQHEADKILAAGITNNFSQEAKKLKQIYGLPKCFNITRGYQDQNRIATACYLVIGGFSGMRYSEIASADKLAYHERSIDSENSISYIRSYSTKTNKGIPKETDWVTVPETKLAIELWHEIFEPARKKHRQELEKTVLHKDEKEHALQRISSLCVQGLGIGKVIKEGKQKSYITQGSNLGSRITKELKRKSKIDSTLLTTIEDVKEFDKLNPTCRGQLEVGKVLAFSTHMVRRTFAVFIIRNRLGSIIDLKHQFKHLNVYMTQWYTNQVSTAVFNDLLLDRQFIDEMREINIHFQSTLLADLYNHGHHSGKAGTRIITERDFYVKGDSGLYMTYEDVRWRVEMGMLSIVEHPTGYCTNPTCSRICASDQSAVTCEFEIVTKDKAVGRVLAYNNKVKRFTEVNESAIYMPNILYKMKMDILAMQKTFEHHAIEYKPFNGEINEKNNPIYTARA